MATPHILLIDDDRLITELYTNMLHTLGYGVSVFNSSSKAFAAFSDQPDSFDLVITDLVMPELDGVELAGRISALRPEVPILLCTGNRLDFSDAQLTACGIRTIIHKPVKKKELAAALTALLPALPPTTSPMTDRS